MFEKPMMLLAVLAMLCGGSAAAAADEGEKLLESTSVLMPPTAAAQPGTMGVEHVRAGWYRIRSWHGDRKQCLDADANAGGNGTKVQVWTCNGTNQQLWFWDEDGSMLNALFPKMCLDADTNGGGANGTRVQLWECNKSAQQQWGTRPNDVAIYNLKFFDNGNTVLDRDLNVTGNGAPVQLWEKNFESQQWWGVE